MKLFRGMSLLAAAAGAVLLAAPIAQGGADEMGFVRIAPEDVQWKELPGYGGLQYAVLEGDPSKPGIYVVRVKFPPGLMTRPHFHPEDRHAIVIKGTWYTGTGDTFDPEHRGGLEARHLHEASRQRAPLRRRQGRGGDPAADRVWPQRHHLAASGRRAHRAFLEAIGPAGGSTDSR